jgi:hypothetical protein
MDGPPPSPRLIRLSPDLNAWLIRGECGNVNCGYALAVRDGQGYRLILEDAGYEFRLEPATGRGVSDVTVEGRSGALRHVVTTWHYDGRVYRRQRCQEAVVSEGRGGTQWRVREIRCDG